jgi:hypothetical protein
MVRRRRNLLVLWDWSPGEAHKKSHRNDPGRKRSVVREAIGAAVLLGTIIFLLSNIPNTGDGYRRDRLARFMCETVGIDPGTPQCVAVSIGGWFAIVVAIGIVLKLGRVALQVVRTGREDS